MVKETQEARFHLMRQRLKDAIEVCDPQTLLELVNALDAKTREAEKLDALLGQMAHWVKKLLDVTKGEGIGREDRESQDAELFHSLETSLNAVNAVRDYIKK